MDLGFPTIRYDIGETPRQWGRGHGEQYREGIKELANIRRLLMRERNPGLESEVIAELALEQWQVTTKVAPAIAEELSGIAEGADISVEDLVVLNNYTDFRDIEVFEQGCTTAFVKTPEGVVCGQTWDMHSSAKDYVCVLIVPISEEKEMVLYNLVGCVGMAGFNSSPLMLAINNLSTTAAVPGLLWPSLVRKLLSRTRISDAEKDLSSMSVASGRAYLLASQECGSLWEVVPKVRENLAKKDSGFLFHTNHCVGKEVISFESPICGNSTTHDRYDLVEDKIKKVNSFSDLMGLFADHDGYPKSVCSHYEATADDPSTTCGGFVGNLDNGELLFWRGCKEYDDNYKEFKYKI